MTHQTGTLLALTALLCACDSDNTPTENAKAQVPAQAAAEAEAEQPKDAGKQKRAKRDRGEMSMMLGDVKWEATSARARLKDKKLKITGSRMDGSVQTSMVRQALDLQIADFNGPGSYEVPRGHQGMMSNFSVVGLDTKSITEADSKPAGEQQDKAMSKELMKSLADAKLVHLGGAKVEITAASDSEISGTFSFDDGKHQFTDGKFRAVIKK